ncbi:MAG: hypothetical protein V7K48_32425 [Nostoc sp.]
MGSEAYAAALQVYNYAKVSGQGTGLDTWLKKWGNGFPVEIGKSSLNR